MKSAAEQKRNYVKREIKRILIELAPQDDTEITYSDLIARVEGHTFTGPNDPFLKSLLTEISREEDHEDRGMLSVVVVNQETGIPGDGFFELASELGRQVSDSQQCFEEERARVAAAWRT